jgi:transcriptional regulator with PAS, ATPase and Fis domain
VDLRVIAATNRKLTDAIEQGKFRLDLYYRLNVIQVVLPPLRDRREDILPLAENFIRHYNAKFKRNVQGVSHGAAAGLLTHNWPGNVRELRNVIERAIVLEDSEWIQLANLQIAVRKGSLSWVNCRFKPAIHRRTSVWRRPRKACSARRSRKPAAIKPAPL